MKRYRALCLLLCTLPAIGLASLTQAADPAGANMEADSKHFPEPLYITFKADGAMGSLPSNRHWPGGPDMLYDALSPDGKTLVATSPSSNSLYVFDAVSGEQQAVIPVGSVPKGVKISPDGYTVYVCDEGGATVSVVDLQQMQRIATIKVEKIPHNVRFNQDGSLAYVTLQGGAGLGVINTRTHSLEKIIPVPGITGPHNLDLSADGKTAWIRDFVHHVAVLDLESEQVTHVIKVGNGHGGIDMAPDGSFVATAAIGSDIITVINPKTLESTDIQVGKGTHGVRASKDSRWIYASVTQENRVVVIDARTLKVVEKIDVGGFPFWLALAGNR